MYQILLGQIFEIKLTTKSKTKENNF